jgi:membrane fusion protein (multidrug efflux system)
MRAWLLLGALAAGLSAGCSEVPEAVDSAPPVLLVPVELFDVQDRIEATGELRACSEAIVAAEISGRVTGIPIQEGERAEEGDVVIEIDPQRRELDRDTARAGLAEARAALAEAERDHERMRRLHAKAAVSVARLDQALTTLEQARSRQEAARARLGVAERALRDAKVAAPFAGQIAERRVSRGEFVDVGSPLFRLVALDPVEVRFQLAERDSGRVSLGDAVLLSVAPFPDERFQAKVSMISPTIDPRTRTLTVEAELPNPEGRLRPGLFARVELGVAQRAGVPMVPEEAILQRADGPVVFRLIGEDRVERRSVELGVFQDGLVEVRSGLAGGDRVVARGHSRLVDGVRVSSRDADGNPLAPGAGAPAVAERGP